MNIDDYISLAANVINTSDTPIIVEKDWSQGRTIYGGLSAALLYAAAKPYVDNERLLRSMTCNFVGPLLSQQAFTISVEIIRAGKNVSQVQARAIQDGKICVVSQFCFGQSRESKIEVLNHEVSNMPLPKKGKFIPQIPKVTPKFLKHFELAFTDGGVPFTGQKASHIHGWMRYKTTPKTLSDAHIIGIIDAWPPTVLQMLRWPAPASTVSWNLEFIHPHRPLNPEDWFAYKVNTRQAAGGYAHTEATIWDSHDEVIALSRQTVAVFD
ncbi:acyl-CoA thioesterase [Glaciecola petra]|uniref:Thioesterase family protein n=1 Tax=Glaciecola petra TaxID=3075602 RepID=A0ABU2ZNH5_9ALTE|nr:thioesterase family protein [Aestuariibacter sp. P117]MDT0594178.1 thioesterase family protein [Aestuariibacter sp. P117]